MKKSFFSLLLLLAGSLTSASAQEFDPLLDPLCKVMQAPEGAKVTLVWQGKTRII